MKKTMKILLALATAALLGSSAWATVNPTSLTLEVGESKTVTVTGSSSTAYEAAFTSGGTAAYGTETDYYKAQLDKLKLSTSSSGTLTVTGKKKTTQNQSIKSIGRGRQHLGGLLL